MTNKEAIEIINNRLNTYYCTDEDLQALDLAIKALENEPKKGKWNKCGWAVECSICGEDFPFDIHNFCPNCGADMRGDKK